MQLDTLRLYRNTLLGAMGGLAGWALITMLVHFDTSNPWMLYLKDGLTGAAVGACIGLALGVAAQAGSGWSREKLMGVLLSGAIGLGAGLIGLIIGEAIFSLAGGGVWPRAVGWAIFGLLLGAGLWPVTKMPSQGIYGALGGALGGLIGGSTYERLSLLLRGVGIDRQLALIIGSAVGLIILGACIGLLISLVENILRKAWLRFHYGPLEGKSFTLDTRRPATTLGRSDACDILIRHDSEMQPVHAAIVTEQGDFHLVARQGVVRLRNGEVSQPVQDHVLQNGDTVQIGRSRFIFYTGEQ